MINFYYYDGQIRKYLLQVTNVFAGLQVQTGKGTCGEAEMMTVPISLGSRDRVVAAIGAGNTQNKPFSLPQMALSMTGLNMAPHRHGIGVIDRKTYLPDGGIYPDDLRVAERVMPIPYIMTCELSIYASNQQQMHQILEQLMMMFDPVLQIQMNDVAFDWTKITTVELTGMTNEENYPPGGDRRIILWSLAFEIPIYISAPMDIKNEIVRSITIRMGDTAGLQFNEFDENGQSIPVAPGFSFGNTTITG